MLTSQEYAAKLGYFQHHGAERPITSDNQEVKAEDVPQVVLNFGLMPEDRVKKLRFNSAEQLRNRN